jgi:hypothetical protein
MGVEKVPFHKYKKIKCWVEAHEGPEMGTWFLFPPPKFLFLFRNFRKRFLIFFSM